MLTAALVVLVVAGLFVSYQFAWWRRTVDYSVPRILMYHMVNRQKPKARFNKLRVDPAEFERQLRWLRDGGWKFVFMSEIEHSTERKTVALTFDDGYRDNYLLADPLLKQYGAKATLYLVVDRHDRDWSQSKKEHHSDGELMDEPKLLDDDVANMLNSGRWELGAHTLTHANLVLMNPEQRQNEIQECRRLLQDRFQTVVQSFAYPFGIFEKEDVARVDAAGFRTAVTTMQGISNNTDQERLCLRRVKVSGHDGLMSFQLRMRTGKCRWRD